MAAEFIGVIVGAISGHVYAVVNPDDDRELDNPRFLLLKIDVGTPTTPPVQNPNDPHPGANEREPLTMVKIPRGDYEACLSMADVAAIVQSMKQP